MFSILSVDILVIVSRLNYMRTVSLCPFLCKLAPDLYDLFLVLLCFAGSRIMPPQGLSLQFPIDQKTYVSHKETTEKTLQKYKTIFLYDQRLALRGKVTIVKV